MPSTRFARLLAVASTAMLAATLTGCKTSQPALWESGYEPRATNVSPVPDAEVRQARSYEALSTLPQIAGRELVGVSRFREEQVTQSLMLEDSELERFGESLGADLIVVATKPAGQEERTKFIRTTASIPTSGGSQDFTGGPPPARESSQESYTAVVDVFDYLVAFYRKQDG